MLGCCLGTEGRILETAGELRVQVADHKKFIGPSIAVASSERMHTSLVKEAAAKT